MTGSKVAPVDGRCAIRLPIWHILEVALGCRPLPATCEQAGEAAELEGSPGITGMRRMIR